MKALRTWTYAGSTGNGFALTVEEHHNLVVKVLEHDLIRVSLLKDGAFRLDRTWAIAPAGDVPWEGRRREELSGFSCPDFSITTQKETIVLETDLLRLTVETPLALIWEARSSQDDPFREIARDRPQDAYLVGRKDHRKQHYMRRFADERHYGLGEKAGGMERSGRRYEMRNLDAMGYDARSTDPLYKHVPFTITDRGPLGAYGLYYDTMAPCWFDLGNEKDNYHPPFRAFRAEDGDLDYYFSWAPTVLEITKRQHWLTGGTAFMPRWGLGYSGSTMAYTDSENAQERLLEFLDKLSEEDMPCDSFQMSSGYTAIKGKRYVFHWNTDRFPDAKAMSQAYADARIHLIANIKPVLLDDHPMRGEAEKAGLFIRDSETGEAEQSPFWDGYGSHLDFTNPATVSWWQRNLKDQLFAKGIDSTWNDNNEYEVWDDEAVCAGFGDPIPVNLIRPLHSQLMTRASYDAQWENQPQKRPYLISRCASPGTQRYAQTWTGDNYTSWDTLRWNIPMGLGLSLSGFYNIGHDVGGFAGPRPGPELFLRWVQNGIFHPRFTIHSWNDDGTANEAWMYPEMTPLVRDALNLRAQLIPYLYSLLFQAVTEGEPMLRPLFLDHPDDPACREVETDFLLGRNLLVATVIEEGATHRKVTLPANGEGWWTFDGSQWHPGGQVIEVPVTLETIPLFVRGGTVLPMAAANQRSEPGLDTSRTWRIYPQPGGAPASQSLAYDDDGDTADALAGSHCLTRFRLARTDRTVHLDWRRTGSWHPAFDRVSLWLAGSDQLVVNGVENTRGQPVVFTQS
ncbi:glycoside hydrolase family 31 protein [Roseibium sediminicola]|uniref:Glycoside hydrolase family 31 protein n=1 Tax=Roseibium sediminicola TaxID=2933272 RepID=A0ABT0H2G3_9HYPH|nr:glycoside hydrolase family 31 protein [Roseibium sp. CAU 1639]MCK7615878.1 glycoside hydrolase family 31 protein [Roseibium sp. CAU 1639]